jgi:hypothetical protein
LYVSFWPRTLFEWLIHAKLAVPDPAKRDRALEGLLTDGLIVNVKRGYELPK